MEKFAPDPFAGKYRLVSAKSRQLEARRVPIFEFFGVRGMVAGFRASLGEIAFRLSVPNEY